MAVALALNKLVTACRLASTRPSALGRGCAPSILAIPGPTTFCRFWREIAPALPPPTCIRISVSELSTEPQRTGEGQVPPPARLLCQAACQTCLRIRAAISASSWGRKQPPCCATLPAVSWIAQLACSSTAQTADAMPRVRHPNKDSPSSFRADGSAGSGGHGPAFPRSWARAVGGAG